MSASLSSIRYDWDWDWESVFVSFAGIAPLACGAVSPDSYIRTFRNSKDRNPWDEESERILVNLMDS